MGFFFARAITLQNLLWELHKMTRNNKKKNLFWEAVSHAINRRRTETKIAINCDPQASPTAPVKGGGNGFKRPEVAMDRFCKGERTGCFAIPELHGGIPLRLIGPQPIR